MKKPAKCYNAVVKKNNKKCIAVRAKRIKTLKSKGKCEFEKEHTAMESVMMVKKRTSAIRVQ